MDECEMRSAAVEYAVLWDRYWESEEEDERETILNRMQVMRLSGGLAVRDKAYEILERHKKVSSFE